MTVSLSPIGGVASQFFNSGGVPLYGGKIYTYEAGTTTPKATYTEANGLTAHPNPIILNSAGRVPGGEIWLTSAQAYLFILKNSSDETIGTYDNIYGINAGGANAVTETQVATAGQTDFVLTSMAYTPGVFTLGVYVDGVNQVINNSYVETSATTVTFVSGLHVGALVKFININSAATDSNVVSYLPAGVGAVATTVQTKLRQIVQVNDFVTGGSGTTGDPWTGWDTSITWSQFTQYDFIDGYYSYATSPNFAFTGLKLNGKAGTVIRHTGIGQAMTVDAGPTIDDLRVYIDIGGFVLESNSGASGGVYSRGITRSKFDIKFHNVPGICFRDVYGVLNKTRLAHTAISVGATIIPQSLLAVDKRNTGELSSANEYYLIAENISSTGVVLNDCVNSVFIAGTSEANAAGFYISSTSSYNTFLNSDLESNSAYDINCLGSYNNFIGILSSTTATFNGFRNTILGGIYNTIINTGTRNVFTSTSYSSNGGTFTDSGVDTRKHDVYYITTSSFDVDIQGPIKNTYSASGNTGSILNSTATTMFSLPAGVPGVFRVSARLPAGLGTPANYSSSAEINWDGVAGRITANNGAQLSLTLSGSNVQVSQSTGATQVAGVNWSYATQYLL